MINVRNGVFETNSSSCHSIVIKKGGGETPDKIDPDWRVYDDGDLYIYEDNIEFSRSPFDVLCDWYHKMCYAIASYEEEGFDRIESLVIKHVNKVKFIRLPLTWNDENQPVPYYGYVDHQSLGLLENFLRKNNVTLEDFIFNDKYIVIIDGDEYCIFEKLQDCGLLNKDAIEERMSAFDD